MTERKNYKVTWPGWVLVAACLAAAASAADKPEGGGLLASTCEATGLAEECRGGNIEEAKQLIRKAYDAAIVELRIAIKNTSFYQKLEKDYMTRQALDVCEVVLADSIEDLDASFQRIAEFKIEQMDRSLDVVRIWISAAITDKGTCFDAFAKTKGESGRVVRQMLTKSDELLSKCLHMVIEFQKNFQSIKKQLGEFVGSIKPPRKEGKGESIPDFVEGHARKMIENPRISLPPNVVVAKDGSGQFRTIMEAVNSIPLKNKNPVVILVKEGVYSEYVMIPKTVDHVILVGEGPLKTRITGNKSYSHGYAPFFGATVIVEGEHFIAKDIGFENTAGPVGHQGVALRTSGDMGVYYNVHMDAYQDTLYPSKKRQLFRECRISGTVDFIFGDSIAVFQKCELVVRMPGPRQQNMVTAQGRYKTDSSGIIVIQACNITAEKALLEANPPIKSFLGRPWKVYARTIIMQTTIGGFIDPTGWAPWEGSIGLDTLQYGEYRNYGPGSDLSQRVTWPGILKINNDDEASQFTPRNQFAQDEWVLETGVPYSPGFM